MEVEQHGRRADWNRGEEAAFFGWRGRDVRDRKRERERR